MKQDKILFIGCGDIASRAAIRLASEGYFVAGLRRQAEELPAVIKPFAVDIFDKNAMAQVMQIQWHTVVITLTAEHYNEASYRHSYVDGLMAVLDAITVSHQSPRVLYASSTSIYAQANSEWVNEQSETLPTTFSGKTMLAAEQLLADSPLSTSAIRFSGIYGGKRQRLLQSVLHGELAVKEPVIYSNRIHCDDCAGVLAHFARQGSDVELAPHYLATDHQPATMHELTYWLADQLGVSEETRVDIKTRRRSSSKRCSNALLLESGYQFQYRNYMEGYREAIEEHRANLSGAF